MTTKKQMARCLALILCAALLTISVAAYGRVEMEKPVSLTLTYQHTDGGQTVPGMTLRLYKVYDMSDAVHFTPTATFLKAYQGEFAFDLGSWETQGKVDWPKMASTLESLLARDAASQTAVPPVRTGKTDEKGTVEFKSNDQDPLLPGLYLVTGDSLNTGSYTYTPQTFLVSLPMLQEDDTWLYPVLGKGKMSFTPNSSGGGGTTSVSVVKKWEDEEGASLPNEVMVQLLQDGKPYQTVRLDAAANWQHTWNNLSANSRWQLAEVAVPEDYTVSVTQVGTTFVVTNTKTVEIPGEKVPGAEKPEGTPESGELPEIEIPAEGVPLGGGLPVTGMIWWPVQLLTVIGLVLFTIGFVMNHRGKRRNHGQ